MCTPDREGVLKYNLQIFTFLDGKGIMTTVPAWCVSAHASFVFEIGSQKNSA